MTDRGTRRQSSAEHNAGDDPSGDTAWDAGAANLAGMSSADSAPPWAMLPTGTLAPDVRQVVFIDSSVPDAALPLTFSVAGAGKIIATDAGDNADHSGFQKPERNAYHGSAIAIVRATSAAGSYKVTVSAPGIEPATVTVH